jgi:hypothetical protein
METKQALANLIDAYADAKKSGNETLMRLAASPLQEFLAGHDIIPISQSSQQTEDAE